MENSLPIILPIPPPPVKNERPFECEICSKTFTKKKNLSVHIRSVHLELKTHPCSICGKIFMDPILFQHHMLTHTGKPVRECGICHKLFSRTTTLRNHMQLHLKDEKYGCPKCGKPNGTKFDLECHMRTHTGERPYQCFICRPIKGFATPSSLMRHVRTHSGYQPHECQTCKKTFARKDQYRRHLKKHLAIHCQGCGKFFEKYSKYVTHQLTCSDASSCDPDSEGIDPSEVLFSPTLDSDSPVILGGTSCGVRVPTSSSLEIALGHVSSSGPDVIFEDDEEPGSSNAPYEKTSEYAQIYVVGENEETKSDVLNVIIENDELDHRKKGEDGIDDECLPPGEEGKSIIIVEQ